VKSDFIELLSVNFNSKELNELGKLVVKNYDAHEIHGIKNHITVSPRRGADILVNFCEEKRKTKNLIKLIVELDDSIVNGKHVVLKGLDNFLCHLAQQGYVYDFKTRKVLDGCHDVEERANWGSLRDGKIYDVTVMSIDIVGNSKLVKRNGMKKMEAFYHQFWQFMKNKLYSYDGRLWSWAGDGGILAFTFKDHINKAALFAIEVQCNMPVFNLRPDKPVDTNIEVRIGIDTGKVKFCNDTGRIVSDTVNYAAHLEKKGTQPGKIAVSDRVFCKLDPASASIFIDGGPFEDRNSWITYRRLDDMFFQLPGDTRIKVRKLRKGA